MMCKPQFKKKKTGFVVQDHISKMTTKRGKASSEYARFQSYILLLLFF